MALAVRTGGSATTGLMALSHKNIQNNLGKEYEVIPEGLNGRTTAYDRPMAPWKNGLNYLQTCLVSHYPLDYVIFMLGTNDCLVEMNLSAEETAQGMEKLINATNEILLEKQGFNPKIIVVSPAPILADFKASPFAEQLSDKSVENSNQLSALYKKIAEKHNCEFLDGTSVLEVSKTDCEHLTKKGHKTLGNLLASMIIKPKQTR